MFRNRFPRGPRSRPELREGALRYVEIENQRGGRRSDAIDAQAVREVASQPAADPVADPVAKDEADAAARAPDGSPGSG